MYDKYLEKPSKGWHVRKGTRIKVTSRSTSTAPTNWKGFLRVDENKTELSELFCWRYLNWATIIITFHGTHACQQNDKVECINPTDHEEADDTRVLLHVNDMSRKGVIRVIIHHSWHYWCFITSDVTLRSSEFSGLNLEQFMDWFRFRKQRCYLLILKMVLEVKFSSIFQSRTFHPSRDTDGMLICTELCKCKAKKMLMVC